MVLQLLHANMIVDPRYITSTCCDGYQFSFSVNGRTLTITRTDRDEHEDGHEGWHAADLRLRAYMPMEGIHDFTLTVYTYWGLLGEEAPKDTTEAFIHPSVNTIKDSAFYDCKSLVRVTIPDTVTHIEDAAFESCDSLTFLQLSRNLERIGNWAFHRCNSLDAIYLPPTVTHIGYGAFQDCTSLRFFFFVPASIVLIGINVVWGCDRLLTTVKYKVDDPGDILNSEVNQWLMQRHANFHLHRACSSTFVTPQMIEVCIHTHGIEHAMEVDDQQMTALHTSEKGDF